MSAEVDRFSTLQ